MRYECRWKEVDGRNVHYWVDNQPNEPHWPPSAVMRWDLKPDDWHKVWIELVDHPCALLFAPTHPNRNGPPVFADWVASWPQGYDWQADLPAHLHPKVLETLALLQQKRDVPTPDPAPVIEHTLTDAPHSKTNVAEIGSACQPFSWMSMTRTGQKSLGSCTRSPWPLIVPAPCRLWLL